MQHILSVVILNPESWSTWFTSVPYEGKSGRAEAELEESEPSKAAEVVEVEEGMAEVRLRVRGEG